MVKFEFDNVYCKNNLGRMSADEEAVVWEPSAVGPSKVVIGKDILKRVEVNRSGRKYIVRFFVTEIGSENDKIEFFTNLRKQNVDDLHLLASTAWQIGMEDFELSVKGWNNGKMKLKANSIDFTSAKRKCFDLYYDDMEQCVATKNDLIIEFKEKDQPFEHESLSEIRFHVPIGEMDNFLSKSQNDDSDATFLSASQLSERIRNRADLTFSPKNAVVKFANQQLITPRGRYEVGLSRDTLFLHGKTFSYKSKLRDFYKMFLLPNDDGHYLAVNLKKPLNFGKTFYHFVIIKFGEDSQITVSVDIPQKEIEEKYDGKLSREMEGPSFRITTRIFKTLSNTKVFMPGSFENTTEQKYIRCAMKTSAGFLYPMEASFVFCPKPVVYVQHSKIESVSFLRLLNSMSSTKMFDLALTLKKDHKNARKDAKIVFTGIDKREFPNLFKFLASKNLRILDKEIYEKRLNLSDAGQRSCRISGATNVILPSGNSDTSSDEDFDETKTLDQLDRKLRETTENIENEEISSSSEIDVDDI